MVQYRLTNFVVLWRHQETKYSEMHIKQENTPTLFKNDTSEQNRKNIIYNSSTSWELDIK